MNPKQAPSYEELERQVADLKEETRGLAKAVARFQSRLDALSKNGELLDTVIQLTADGILAVDNEGRILLSNEQFGRMWNIPPDLIQTGDDPKLLSHVLDQLKDPDAFLSKVQTLYVSLEDSLDRLEFKDGRAFERFSRALIRDDEIQGRIWNFRDITNQCLAEASIRKERDAAQKYLDVAAVIIMAVDIDGTIDLINKRGCELLELEESEILGRSAFEFLQPNSEQKQIQEIFQNVMSGTMPALDYYETSVKTGGGMERVLAWRSSLLRSESGEATGLLCSGEDITERKKTEKFVLSAHLEAQFYVDLMSHDLANYNHTLLVNLQLLEKKVEGQESALKTLRSCLRQVQRSESLISNVRSLFQARREPPGPYFAADLKRAIANSSEAAARRHPEKNVEFLYYGCHDKTVRGGELLNSVFLNLMENAIKHSHKDSVRIEVEASETDPPGDFWRVRITDDGPGIPESEKERIFERHWHVGNSQGDGLGLFLVKSIVERLDGSIEVRSRDAGSPSGGTAFILRLPKGLPS